MPSPEKRFFGKQRTGQRFLQIFKNDRGFEQYRPGPFALFDLQKRHLAERGKPAEPIRLVGKIDVDPLERNPLFVERDRRALDVRAKVVTDQFQVGVHGGLLQCNCMFLKYRCIRIYCQP